MHWQEHFLDRNGKSRASVVTTLRGAINLSTERVEDLQSLVCAAGRCYLHPNEKKGMIWAELRSAVDECE